MIVLGVGVGVGGVVDGLVGMPSAKAEFERFVNMARLESNRRAAGLPATHSTRHVVLVGTRDAETTLTQVGWPGAWIVGFVA